MKCNGAGGLYPTKHICNQIQVTNRALTKSKMYKVSTENSALPPCGDVTQARPNGRINGIGSSRAPVNRISNTCLRDQSQGILSTTDSLQQSLWILDRVVH